MRFNEKEMILLGEEMGVQFVTQLFSTLVQSRQKFTTFSVPDSTRIICSVYSAPRTLHPAASMPAVVQLQLSILAPRELCLGTIDSPHRPRHGARSPESSWTLEMEQDFVWLMLGVIAPYDHSEEPGFLMAAP